ncbi:hypothetical protein ABN028_24580 [Actinopolymorpha sp. B17G11]|uniref:hypothetical protein n=1 Tax=Actinopolymorpha sp. B17G11 TaxID=3160861 RepID=UPI0032E4A226
MTCRWAAEDLGAMLAAAGIRQSPVLVDPSDLSLWLDTAIPKTQLTDSDDDHASFNIPISLGGLEPARTAVPAAGGRRLQRGWPLAAHPRPGRVQAVHRR